MSKFIKILCLTCVLTVTALAQNSEDEYKKNEFYVGYTNQQSDGFRGRSANGAQASYVRNVSRFVGIKGDFSATFQKSSFNGTFLDQNGNPVSYNFRNFNSRYNFLGGVQIKDNASKTRFKPFVHALAGVAVNRTKTENLPCPTNPCTTGGFLTASFQNTNFSAALGGGLDIKINDRLDFRAFQVDYNPTFGSGSYRNSVRIGVGFVIK